MFGNWSRKTQMRGYQPTPNAHLKNLLSKRFKVVEVDEFRTPKTCNSCMGTLKATGPCQGSCLARGSVANLAEAKVESCPRGL